MSSPKFSVHVAALSASACAVSRHLDADPCRRHSIRKQTARCYCEVFVAFVLLRSTILADSLRTDK